MSNAGYYKRFLKFKSDFNRTVEEDERLNFFATTKVGIKPQGTAVEMVVSVYCKYCDLFNRLCDIYDQMHQVQRREYLRKMIDAITCRILELKAMLEDVESFEYTYFDNGIKQMFMMPDNVQIMCPFFYPLESREEEMQYLVDEIMSGNRLGDPTPTPSEIERREEERLELERIAREEKEAENMRKIAMGEELSMDDDDVVYTAAQLEEMRLEAEYKKMVTDIQRMERAKNVIFENTQKKNKNANLYLELAGLKKPQRREYIRKRAVLFIQKIYRRFMEVKREHAREYKLKLKLEMVIPSMKPPSAKIQLAKVQQARREFRRNYMKKWMDQNIKQKDKIMRWKKGKIMEDITTEIKQWFHDWYYSMRVFDEYPWPEEGGSILIVRGETLGLDEYEEWKKVEEKRLKVEASNPKTKEDIKAEKLAAKEEKKRLAADAKERERKQLIEYKKLRLTPDNDPGVYFGIEKNLAPVLDVWREYQNEWKKIDQVNPQIEAVKGHIIDLILKDKYKEANLELRPIVDEMMRMELNLLRAALKRDYDAVFVKIPITQKRKRPKKIKPPKPDKVPPKAWFQRAVDNELVVKYPRVTLDDFWGDRNYAEADNRAILWTPKFTSPCLGDVQEQIRVRCLMALGANCPKMNRTQLLVGPKNSGKRLLAYAIATETNSILIDMSPLHIYDKMPGKLTKQLYATINKVSRLMQPTVILVNDADKMFYKKVPKEEKMFDPTRLSKDFFKEIVKNLKPNDKILVIGTASEPWLAKAPKLKKVFPQVILLPRSDYGSLSYILSKELMTYHGINRDFNVNSVAQCLRGFDVNHIRLGIKKVLNGKRVAELKYKPLEPLEILNAVIENEESVFTDDFDYGLYKNWYNSYSPFGEKFDELQFMLASQLDFKMKQDKKKKK